MQLEHLDSLLVAAFRHEGPHAPQLTGDTWERLILWASPRRLLGRSFDVRAVGLLWDDPRVIPPEYRRYDVAIPIDEEDASSVDLPAFALRTMPGEYLHVAHSGSYDTISETYDEALGINFRVDGCVLLAAPMLEVYRNSPSEVDEDELLTDIYIPVLHPMTAG